MTEQKTVCLLNDSFPPLIDGVANTVVNYAAELSKSGYCPMVVTPDHSNARDQAFDYPIVRYPSIKTGKFEGYPAGIPFSPEVASRIGEQRVSLLHTHCPIMSTFMARQLRQITGAPIVFTYHTKFDVDIENIIRTDSLQHACKKALVQNICACDEVWVVSHGAGENLRQLGYAGDYLVMPNGVDMPLGKAPGEDIRRVAADFDLPAGVPVYLFVGRMMWYKGLRIIIDALAMLKARGKAFRMVFIGGGEHAQEVAGYAGQCGVAEHCIFTGTICDRAVLRAWYSSADLLLFPSTYDTNGLVVREAAASGVAAVLIEESCAAEGIIHGRNGYLICGSAQSMAALLQSVSIGQMRAAGEAAAREIYLSWSDAVKMAAQRYQIVIEKNRSGGYPRKHTPTEGILRLNGEMMELLSIIRRKL